MESLQRTANRGSVSTGPYQIDNSVKLEDDNDEYLTRTNASGTNRKTFTVSAWFKQTELATQLGHITEIWDGGTNGNATRMGVYSDDRLWVDVAGGTGNTGTQFRSLATLKLRDTSAWYHMVLAVDTTQSTEANRMKVWLNGTEVTAWDQHQIPTEDYECSLESGTTMSWGSYNSTYHGFSGYLAECNYLDGVTATQNDFGEYDDDTGIWIPKQYTGSYAGQSAYLNFSDSSDLGANSKGDDVNFTLVNIAAADQATDTPTNNFTTWNPLVLYDAGAYTFPNGATEIKKGASNGWVTVYGNMGVNKGKWYAEFEVLTSGELQMMGQLPLTKIRDSIATQFYLGADANGLGGSGYYTSGTSGNDTIYYGGGYTSSGVTTSAGDIISVAMDCDNNKVHYAVNGTYTNSSNPANNTNGFAMSDDYQFFASSTYTQDKTFKCNFGGYTTDTISSAATDANGYGTFEYSPPSGYYSLCTKNLAEYG